MPYKSTVALAVPPGHHAMSVTYTCGPLWGSGYVHGPTRTPFPRVGSPCSSSNRTEDQTVTIVDLVLCFTAAVLILTLGEHAPARRLRSSR
jgi:hypothetical protein